jgi:hypothetical protein
VAGEDVAAPLPAESKASIFERIGSIFGGKR